MRVKQAAMMAFNDDKAGIQTADSTAELGVSTGSAIPQVCMDRKGSAKVYPMNYNLYVAETGELWQPANPMGQVTLYNFNTSTTDQNGNIWAGMDYPLWKTDYTGPATPQPVGRMFCHSGQDCYYGPSEQRADLGGHYFGKNSLPDGFTFSASSLSGHSHDNSAGYTGNTIVKWEDVLVVPPQVAAGQCSALTLAAMISPAPDTLNCGSASAKNVAQEGNKAMAIPTVPTKDTYINGVRVN